MVEIKDEYTATQASARVGKGSDKKASYVFEQGQRGESKRERISERSEGHPHFTYGT